MTKCYLSGCSIRSNSISGRVRGDRRMRRLDGSSDSNVVNLMVRRLNPLKFDWRFWGVDCLECQMGDLM